MSDNSVIKEDNYLNNSSAREEDIEHENVDSESYYYDESKAPFDPMAVRIQTPAFTIGQLLDRLEHNEINLETDFQRNSDLWSIEKQSQLIESILMGLPLPAFYFDAKNTGFWDVIDGLQRISAFRNLILGKSTFKGFQFLKHLNGKNYSNLPREVVRRINTYPITVNLIEAGTPEEVKFILFKRLNTGGLTLNSQEIRNAVYHGQGSAIIKEFSELDSFKMATCGKVPTRRMVDRDFIARFMAFYLQGYRNYRNDLDSYLNDMMNILKGVDEHKLKKTREDFNKSMNTAYDIFFDDAFRKRKTEEEPKKPINKSIFEILSVEFALLSSVDCKRLIERKESFKAAFRALVNEERFWNAISEATGKRSSVEYRFESIKRIINKTLTD